MRHLLAVAAIVLAMAPIPAAASSDCPFVNKAFCTKPIQTTPSVPACNTVDRFAVACYLGLPTDQLRVTVYPRSQAIESDDGTAQWTDYDTEASIQHGLVMRCLHEWHHTGYQADDTNQLPPEAIDDLGWVYCEPANT